MERLVSKARGETKFDEQKELEARMAQVAKEREEKMNEHKNLTKSYN